MQEQTRRQEHPRRTWDAGASLRTTARRIASAEGLLQEHIQNAYAQGMSVRQIGRHVGRSHAWVIDQLRAAGVYQEGNSK